MKTKMFFILFTLVVTNLYSQPGTIDSTFIYDYGVPYQQGNVTCSAIQNDGKIILAGTFTSFRNLKRGGIIRLNQDGTIDYTFDSNIGFSDVIYISDIKFQNDGKILICGRFTEYNGIIKNGIIRLFPNGTIDPSFNIGTGFSTPPNEPKKILPLDDGKIMVCGAFQSFNGIPINGIFRLNSDGSIDESFNIDETILNYIIINDFEIQPDGKIICVGGLNVPINGTYCNGIMRINNDGSLDNTFSSGIGFETNIPNSYISVSCVKLLENGDMLVGGSFSTYDGEPSNNIIKLNSDGSKDNSFNLSIGSNENNSIVRKIIIQPDGKIIIGGLLVTLNGNNVSGLIRIDNVNNNLETDFNILGAGGYLTILLNSESKIICSGAAYAYSNMQLSPFRLNSDGSFDTSFDLGFDINDEINSVDIQNDQKIICGGKFTSYDNLSRNRILRLLQDGSTDPSFLTGLGFNDEVKVIKVQQDQKILVGGLFTAYNGDSCNRIVRLNSNGSIDNTFDIGTGFNNTVNFILLQSDGKIIVGGEFTSYNGNSCNKLIRLAGQTHTFF
ncbi:MAG: hypothetical protein HYU67_09115 [Flavobacteriia bacterium]|nr:hypothetical protein [Flavobacteriia bacterium]